MDWLANGETQRLRCHLSANRMKILILDQYYEAFLNDFYASMTGLRELDYSAQRKALLDKCFGTADFYSKNLTELGHKTEDVIINDRRLQLKWAKQNHLVIWKDVFDKIPAVRIFLHSDWLEKVLESQITAFDPDVIYCQSLYLPGSEFLKRFQKATRKRRLIVGQVASGVNFDPKELAAFDLILTSFPHYVPRFRKIGVNSEYFRLGFEESLLKKLTRLPQEYSTVFVGGFSRHHLADTNFLRNFNYLARKTPVDFWGYGGKNLSKNSPIRKTFHGEAWGFDMYNVLFNAKICLNRHIPAAENYANNMRLFESTGVGTMLITDLKDNLHELFEIGKEIETYL